MPFIHNYGNGSVIIITGQLHAFGTGGHTSHEPVVDDHVNESIEKTYRENLT